MQSTNFQAKEPQDLVLVKAESWGEVYVEYLSMLMGYDDISSEQKDLIQNLKLSINNAVSLAKKQRLFGTADIPKLRAVT